MTTYAQIDTNSAFLFTEFGEKIARKWFGDALVDTLPRFTKGARKGKLKGQVSWQKVVRGGWVRSYEGGYVENRVGRIFDRELRELAPWGSNAKGNLILALDDQIERIAAHVHRIDSYDREIAEIQAKIDDRILKIELVRQKVLVAADRAGLEEILNGDIDGYRKDIEVLVGYKASEQTRLEAAQALIPTERN